MSSNPEQKKTPKLGSQETPTVKHSDAFIVRELAVAIANLKARFAPELMSSETTREEWNRTLESFFLNNLT